MWVGTRYGEYVGYVTHIHWLVEAGPLKKNSTLVFDISCQSPDTILTRTQLKFEDLLSQI